MADNGWIKLKRSANTMIILKKPKVFALLSQIAIRARRTNQLNFDDLSIGEALIGDHAACGLTRQEYRTATKQLQKRGLVTFRTTNKGTIAKILDSSIYDINLDTEQPTNQLTVNQPTANKKPESNQQATTNNKEKKEKKEKTTTFHVDDVGFSEVFKKTISSLGMTDGGLRLLESCNNNIENVYAWIVWGKKQKIAKNPAGLILSESSKISSPSLSTVMKTELNKLLKKEFRYWAEMVYDELKTQNSNINDGICQKITESELGYDRPKNKTEALIVINAIKNNKYNLITGNQIDEN